MARTSFKPTRERKQRRKAQQPQQEQPTHSLDPNAEVIIPDASAKAQRRAELLRTLAAPKMSSKKAKRLKKYIESKLRKEETNILLAKLAETKVDTSLFVSARDIGKAKETKKEKVQRALKQVEAGLSGTGAEEVLVVERHVRGVEEWDEVMGKRRRVEEDEEMLEEVVVEQGEKESLVEEEGSEVTQKQTNMDSAARERALLEQSFYVATIGGGLKRPLEVDELGKPIIKKIKRTKAPQELVRATPARAKYDYNKPDSESEGEGEEEDKDTSMDGDSEEEESEAEDEEEEAEEWNGFSDSIKGESSEGEDGSSDEAEESSSDNDNDGFNDGNDTDDDGPDASESESNDAPVPRLKKGTSAAASAFKAWAESARLKALGVDEPKPENSIPIFPKLPPGVTLPRRASSTSPAPEPISAPSTPPKPASFVTVNRPEDIQLSRLNLPIVALEQPIMETISVNSTVVICGATGSGKTTQVPQFLYEAGYGNSKAPDSPGIIGITQPRRVAAVSMAKRVQEELGEDHKGKVGYQIRFEGTVGPETAIKFMTDGVLLRELARDILLTKYSAIVIDEAHERGVNTDILIGIMSRVVRLREEMHKEDSTKTKLLKLIIMSATLRVSDFTENKSLFSNPPPVINAEARQFPVSMHFSRRTARDYVDEAYKKICKMHRQLPSGGILVFLTSQHEIQYLKKKLREKFPLQQAEKEEEERNEKEPKVKILAREAVVETEDVELTTHSDSSVHKPLIDDDDERVNDDIDFLSDSDNESDLGGAEHEDKDKESSSSTHSASTAPLHILPLYSLLPTDQQLRIFAPPPPGHRLCVLATNIAETSLTIPNIRYVVDTGRVKSRTYNKSTGVTSYDITWVSKASAAQRAGRAGRTGPGHCYRLYSSAVFERDFKQFSDPEILGMPIEGVVLQMKGMNIEKVVNFPFPTPPGKEELRRAERVLGYLGALKAPSTSTELWDAGGGRGMLTDIGRAMAMFPLPPRFAKILIIGQQHGCLPYVIAIVAGLSIGELFIPEHQLNIPTTDDTDEDVPDGDTYKPAPTNQQNLTVTRAQSTCKAYYASRRVFTHLDPQTDILVLLSAVCAFEYEYSTKGPSAAEAWCLKHFIRYKGMIETRRLRKQLSNIVKANCPSAVPTSNKSKPLVLEPPTTVQNKAIKQIIAAGFIDQIAIRADLLPPTTTGTTEPLPPLRKYTNTTKVPYVTLHPHSTTDLTAYAYIHPTSTLSQTHPTNAPNFVIYSTLTTPGNAVVISGEKKVRMIVLTGLESGNVVAGLAKGTRLLRWGKPLGGEVSVDGEVGEGGLKKEVWCQRILRREGGAGDRGWELGVEKVRMVKRRGGWVVEE
ncbi:P-loop containing nucleoside triphosphate hydrolase protein [Terfezia boudieri ATCC MYA-4762]|uniref:RNA helicase n=1 Tax=Terfezia boudieri ATCC MYA-4762 TaxID=1051890 RepID=A0A3N4LR89_9PEZI|nr:P-loop containing nucleoside triphosphate hydrolase protein [Terfezia boudieri ATCC MYA-4762]